MYLLATLAFRNVCCVSVCYDYTENTTVSIFGNVTAKFALSSGSSTVDGGLVVRGEYSEYCELRYDVAPCIGNINQSSLVF